MQVEIRQRKKKKLKFWHKCAKAEFKSSLRKVKSRILNQKREDNKFEKLFQNREGKDKVMKSKDRREI